ncbi:diguanylate cyclase [Candidatus Accumulibacter sp. ACC003]|uniref:diguanylate cyclase domain-containing protein n=1 Tax=Candidatus Accumulibacter sp. ACC003 TaxID=2823334 RepID=UPI0025BC9FC8|nr:diguanylate cyclase [Candidatus Accumulibacter sp. ACC003]
MLTVLVAAATWWLLRRQLSPLLEMAKTLATLSTRSASAQRPPALPILRQDEIGELVAAFNRLLETLGQREKALQESEAFKNDILNSITARIAVVDHQGVIHDVNKRWRRSAVDDGHEPGKAALYGKVGADYLAFWGSGSECASYDRSLDPRRGIQAVLDGRLPSFSLDYACHLEQQGRWLTMVVTPLGRETGHGAVITHTDITAVKRAEQYEQYRSRILEQLAAGEPLLAILEALVCGVEQLNPGMLCSVLLLDGEKQRLHTGAAPTLPDFFNTSVDGMKIGATVGSCGSAAFTGKRVVVEDIATHPFWARARQPAARAGLRSCWSEPIRASTGEVLGTFAIYHRQPHTPSPSDIAIIEQSANLASIAIEKNLAAEKLQESEAHYRLLTETVSDVVWRQDRDHHFTYISPADERLRGYPADEVIGRHVTEILTKEGVALFREKQRQQEAEEKGVRTGITRFELPQRCKDGRLIWVEVLSTPEHDANGTITGYHGISRDITKRKHEEEQVRQLAFYDPLTALPNRRLLKDRLRQTIASSTRTGCHGAVMFVDLDNFKPLNDQRGHVAGDLLLVETADRLKRCVREIDTVARFGGDEFVVVINELAVDESKSRSTATVIAEKIRSSLSQAYVLTIERDGQSATTYEHCCSASIGVALFLDHQASQDEILKWADAAMFAAKQAGRNVIRFHDRG